MCATSGWNWTPASRSVGFSKAATGAPGDAAVTAKPGGAADTQSPWLIQTSWAAGRPVNRVLSGMTVTAVLPNSRPPVWATSPPSARAIAWKP